jgi:hypothetical protein
MNKLSYTFGLTLPLRGGEALIVVPPFASVERPSLAAHVLQACARESRFQVNVLYANILFASTVGVKNYTAFCSASRVALLGERIFAYSAYDLKPTGEDVDRMMDPSLVMGEGAKQALSRVPPCPD